LVQPKCYYAYNKAVSRVVTKQYLSKQVLDNLAYVINEIPWQVMHSMNDCREQADFSMIELTMLLRRLFQHVLLKSSDRPWITPYFKTLIAK